MKLVLFTGLLLLSHFTQSATLSAHSKSVGIKLSGAHIGQENYTVVGASINYFAMDNLSVGAGYEYWFSGTPSISKAALDATYYIPLDEAIKPYAGVLYSHYFIESETNVGAYGYRVGIAYINAPMLVSAGIKQEIFTSNDGPFSDDDPTGELVIGFSF